jgi:hypothetical protein
MQLWVPDFGEGAFCTWLKHAETVGSSFCRGFGVCQHSNMQIILILQVSHFVEKNGGTHVFDLLAQRPLLSELWNID